MGIIDLFWQLNVSDSTKYVLILVGVLVGCVLCVCLGKKKTTKIDDDAYNEYRGKFPKTKCQQNYVNCVENNQFKGKSNVCFPCANDGSGADFVYDHVSREMLKT